MHKRRVFSEDGSLKLCNKCSLWLPVDDFHKKHPRKDGTYNRAGSCRFCKCGGRRRGKNKTGIYSADGTEKLCCRCRKFLPMSAFYVGKDGYPASVCRPCQAEQSQESRRRHPERLDRTRIADRLRSRDARRRAQVASYRNWATYRARKRSAKTTMVSGDWERILLEHDHRCAYCLKNFDRLEMDHVIALSRGGDHSPENIVPACRSCNARKHNRPVFMMAAKV